MDRLVATTGMGRSTARWLLIGPRLPDPAEQVDGRMLRPRGYSNDARALLAHAGDSDKPFATEQALIVLRAMSAATVDRYVKPAQDKMRIKGISTTKPSPLLRNSVTICTCADDAPDAPGLSRPTAWRTAALR